MTRNETSMKWVVLGLLIGIFCRFDGRYDRCDSDGDDCRGFRRT